MVALGGALKNFERIVVPQPIDGYTTTRVLTMDFISGAKITSLSPLADLLSSNSLRLRVYAIDERELISGLQKIANRIALGLVLAALIVGAALLMQVPTAFRILGYPGLAMIFFLLAVTGGAALAVTIVMSDRKQNLHAPVSPSRSKLT